MFKLRDLKKIVAEFFEGSLGGIKDKSTAMLKKDAFDQNDYFMLLCFSDFLGIPSPTSYYTLELLPYLAEELEGWEKRMMLKGEVVHEQFGKFDYCC